MKVEKMSKRWRSFHAIWLSMVMLCFVQCKESSDEDSVVDFDPSKPITVTDFLPKEGGAGSNLILYGDNFGSDRSRVNVVIGGKQAPVINVKNGTLYCTVPQGAFDGDIKVSVLDRGGEEVARTEAKEAFVYIKKLLSSTLAGQFYEVTNQFEEKEGPFDDCGGFNNINWFSFDPQNPNHMYVMAEGSNARLVDLENEYVSYFRTGLSRVSSMAWRIDGNQDMIVPDNHSSDTRVAHHIFSRANGFAAPGNPIPINARGVNGVMVHPTNGELYYGGFRANSVFRYDFEEQKVEAAFPSAYSANAIYMVVHPSGDYAYLTNFERHYIMKSEYDYERKTFKNPYPVAGMPGQSGYADGVGTFARVNNPVQGVFVKNPDYEAQGGEQYDYYFCDMGNHAIRKVTSEGRVTTFAGRGNNGTAGYANGDLRAETRFDQPRAIAYDEARECFYIGERGKNKVIRKIARETEDDAIPENEEEPTDND